MHNLYHPSSSSSSSQRLLLDTRVDLVINRLDALMMVLKSCQGDTCVAPWKVLHPQGDVTSLSDALQTRFDVFYEQQVKVAFGRCEMGYLVDAEGPQSRDVTTAYEYRRGTEWFYWV